MIQKQLEIQSGLFYGLNYSFKQFLFSVFNNLQILRRIYYMLRIILLFFLNQYFPLAKFLSVCSVQRHF